MLEYICSLVLTKAMALNSVGFSCVSNLKLWCCKILAYSETAVTVEPVCVCVWCALKKMLVWDSIQNNFHSEFASIVHT